MHDPGDGSPGRKGPNEGSMFGWRREKLYVYIRGPYRKPTQVVRKKILRPAGEG